MVIISRVPMFRNLKKIKMLKKDLNFLDKESSCNIEQEADTAYKELIGVQEEISMDPLN